MNQIKQNVLESIQLFTNANTEEIHHESIFDAVKQTLDDKISKEEFDTFFEDKTSVLDTSFSPSFITKLYKEYNWLFNYLYINRSKLK